MVPQGRVEGWEKVINRIFTEINTQKTSTEWKWR